MYTQLITLENLFSAWYEFRKGKRNKKDVLQFERNLEDNIFQLHEELSTKTYRHQGYSTFHIYDPKFRVINKAAVRDRVVHHLVYQYLEPIFQPTFIHQSYSCQVGKGIHKAVEEADKALRKISKNYTRQVWGLKLDIRKFFASVDHEVLLSLLKQKIKDQDILQLLEHIVRSFSSPGTINKGMPIGNLTSQIFANIYMSELDYFAKYTLREKYYFRYADDFLFLHTDPEYLKNLCNTIKQFVTEQLKLGVHPNKIVLRKFSQGLDWLGYVLLSHYRVLRTATKKRMFKKIKQVVEKCNQTEQSDLFLQQSVNSYLGLLKHCNGYKVGEELKNIVWLEKDEVA